MSSAAAGNNRQVSGEQNHAQVASEQVMPTAAEPQQVAATSAVAAEAEQGDGPASASASAAGVGHGGTQTSTVSVAVGADYAAAACDFGVVAVGPYSAAAASEVGVASVSPHGAAATSNAANSSSTSVTGARKEVAPPMTPPAEPQN